MYLRSKQEWHCSGAYTHLSRCLATFSWWIASSRHGFSFTSQLHITWFFCSLFALYCICDAVCIVPLFVGEVFCQKALKIEGEADDDLSMCMSLIKLYSVTLSNEFPGCLGMQWLRINNSNPEEMCLCLLSAVNGRKVCVPYRPTEAEFAESRRQPRAKTVASVQRAGASSLSFGAHPSPSEIITHSQNVCALVVAGPGRTLHYKLRDR